MPKHKRNTLDRIADFRLTDAKADALMEQWMAQLPVIAAMLIEEDPRHAAEEALEIVEACINVLTGEVGA